jgi:hemerythrin-like metal-binding protein
LRDKSQRPGRNLKTGAIVPVAARRVVTFHACQKLKSDCQPGDRNVDANPVDLNTRLQNQGKQGMTLFFWNEQMSVGNTFIDNDHRHFIRLLNDLYNAMNLGRGPDAVGTLLNDLIQYTREHFKREEEVMLDIDYAKFEEHKKEHEKLTRAVRDMQQEFMAGETKLAVGLLKYLFDWLFEHIMNVDKKLAQAILEAASGTQYKTRNLREQRED